MMHFHSFSCAIHTDPFHPIRQVFQVSAPAGCFFPPTLITNVQTSSRVVVDEIFGPVLVALPFRTAKEALSLANNTIYGLGASVWTEKLPLALETAKNIKVGPLRHLVEIVLFCVVCTCTLVAVVFRWHDALSCGRFAKIVGILFI